MLHVVEWHTPFTMEPYVLGNFPYQANSILIRFAQAKNPTGTYADAGFPDSRDGIQTLVIRSRGDDLHKVYRQHKLLEGGFKGLASG